jgi:hypothetical protein
MERNTIELTAHTITIVDENTAIRLAVPVPAFEKYITILIYPPHKPQRFLRCTIKLMGN